METNLEYEHLPELAFTLPVKPKAVQSVRFGKGFAYQPAAVRLFKDTVRLFATSHVRKLIASQNGYRKIPALPLFPRPFPVGLILGFQFPLPQRAVKAQRQKAKDGIRIRNTRRPDLADNLCKGLCDALTGVLWEDDAQICELFSYKSYVSPCEEGIYVHVRVVTDRKDEYL